MKYYRKSNPVFGPLVIWLNGIELHVEFHGDTSSRVGISEPDLDIINTLVRLQYILGAEDKVGEHERWLIM